jgi:hypothetical protein
MVSVASQMHTSASKQSLIPVGAITYGCSASQPSSKNLHATAAVTLAATTPNYKQPTNQHCTTIVMAIN